MVKVHQAYLLKLSIDVMKFYCKHVCHPSDIMYNPKQIEMELLFVEPFLIYEAHAKLLFQQLSPHYMFPCEQKLTKGCMGKGGGEGGGWGCIEHVSSLLT